MGERLAYEVTAAGRAALLQPVGPVERLLGVIHALNDLKAALPIYARTGKLDIATTLLGELGDEVLEIARDVEGSDA